MSTKRFVSLILAAVLLLTVFSGTIITRAADIQSDKTKLLNAIAATDQADRMEIVNYIADSNLNLKTTAFSDANIHATAVYIQGKLGGDASIQVSTVESGLAQFQIFYNANVSLGKFLLTQLKGTLTEVTPPTGLGSLGVQIEEYAGTYKLFVNALLYLKQYIQAEPLEEDASGDMVKSAKVEALKALYYSIGFDSDRLTAYEEKLTYLLSRTNDWTVASEKTALKSDLIKRGVLKQYTQPDNGNGVPVVIATPTPTPTPAPEAKLSLEASSVSADGTAKVTVPADKLDSMFEAAKPGEDGNTAVTITVKAAEGADTYSLELPSDVLSSGKNNNIINIETAAGNISVRGNMFSSADIGTADVVTLSIGISDTSSVKDEASRKLIGDRPVIELKVLVNGAVKEWSNPDAPVTVSISYKPTAEELKNPDCIAICYIDGAGKITVVPNGKYDAAKGVVTFTTSHFSQYAVCYAAKDFSDLTKYEWAKPAIQALAAKGALEGVSSDKFSPQTIITRDEFLAGIVRALGLTATTDGNFSDVKTTNKFYKEIAIARTLKITSGTGNNKFGSGTSITRQDMMTLVVRAMLVKKTMLKATGTVSDISRFTDKAKVSSYAVNGVATCVKEGIIIGSNNSLNPKGNLTKAEAAVVLLRMMKK